MSNLSEKIKQLRKSKGLSQKQLADVTGLSIHTINSYESGRREPNSRAMAALESYFHVTGEYLRGEATSPESQYIWQDSEVMDAVKESFPTLINKLLDSVLHGSAAEQKMMYDILVELCHISSQKKASPEFKTDSFLLISDVLTHTTRFIDFCNRLSISSEVESCRLEKYRQSCIQDYEKALKAFQNATHEH